MPVKPMLLLALILWGNSFSAGNDTLQNEISHIDESQTVAELQITELSNEKHGIRLFIPNGLIPALYHRRPERVNDIYLCVPAAFTTPQNTIDGMYIEKGEVISQSSNSSLNGKCSIKNDSVEILTRSDFDENTKSNLIQSKGGLFEQFLLIKNGEIIPCNAFKERKNLRRAIIKFKNYTCVGESKERQTIAEFQQLLKDLGAIDAIYCDMGTWSEGWYKDEQNNYITIGENMTSTHRQTNWFVYKKP